MKYAPLVWSALWRRPVDPTVGLPMALEEKLRQVESVVGVSAAWVHRHDQQR
jgi:hypothetical protein